MQNLYWRPARTSRIVHVLVALIAVAVLFSAERFQIIHIQPHFDEKLEAAQRMQRGMDVIRTYRIRNVSALDTEVDPTNSGLIGFAASNTTTNTGSLEAKRTTTNPNWAGAVVDLLLRAGVEPGDLIAVGVSGSFPALNLATFVAAEVLDLQVVSIATAGASSWGANIPGLSWLDMERILIEAKVISKGSVAASLGGARDRALGMPRSGRRRLRDAIDRNRVIFIDTSDEISSIDKRMEIYAQQSGGRRYSAYVNAGGSLVSVGPKDVKRIYGPGLILKPHPRALQIDSVIMRFLTDGVPVVNLSKVIPLAEQYGLPVEPTELPAVGEGSVFEKRDHNRSLIAGGLAFLLLSLYGLLKLELGARIAVLGSRKRRPLERMI
ncbi:MAG: poly-gamma-glutamate system protein [Myxococcales bacterium]|nr:poly-gamma-glutamate system protein [Myxococcales bacterium]MDH5306106.1 poly-gamma-glutamate system protein [Myxococcales bacterium]MDH5565432.1 poly-gamma-glutamate system protein [Myxococcales bacterium]